MLKLKKKGQGFRVTRSSGEVLAELETAPNVVLEFEIKIYDEKGLLVHVGKEGESDYWGRGNFAFYILPDADRQPGARLEKRFIAKPDAVVDRQSGSSKKQ